MMSYDRLNFLSEPKPNLPPLSQLLDSKQQQQQQQQQMMMQGFDLLAGYPPAPLPSAAPVAPKNLEHDEKCPFRTDGQPRIPRPRNAFILFRQHHHQAVLDEGNVIKTNPDVSRELGKRWRALPPAEKDYWNKQAEDEKRRHSEKYPGYRYVPRRAGRKGNCPACKARAAQKAAASAAASAVTEPEYAEPYSGVYPGYRPMPGSSLPPLWPGQMMPIMGLPMQQVTQIPQVGAVGNVGLGPAVPLMHQTPQMPHLSQVPQPSAVGQAPMGMNMNMNMNMNMMNMNIGMPMPMGMGGMVFDAPKDEREMVSLPHLGAVMKAEDE